MLSSNQPNVLCINSVIRTFLLSREKNAHIQNNTECEYSEILDTALHQRRPNFINRKDLGEGKEKVAISIESYVFYLIAFHSYFSISL